MPGILRNPSPPPYPPVLLRQSIHVVLLVTAAFLSGCEPGRAPLPTGNLDAGSKIFADYCATCHNPAGLGTKGGAPPLAKSPWVAGSEQRLIRIVLHGVRGPLSISDTTYNLEMPSFGAMLDDSRISSVLTFLRATFGEGAPAVFPNTVREVRRATSTRTVYWTASELLEVP